MKRFIVYSLMSCLFAQIDYETEIQTIFNNNCISCHGNSGGLSLESYANLMTGGNSGTVIISGDHSNSLIWEKINIYIYIYIYNAFRNMFSNRQYYH